MPAFSDLRRAWMRGGNGPTSETVSARRPPAAVADAGCLCAAAAAAEHADDPDMAGGHALACLRAMLVAARRGLPTDEPLNQLVWHALALVSRPEHDARGIAVHLWLSRRPTVAAVLRAVVLWHRRGGVPQ